MISQFSAIFFRTCAVKKRFDDVALTSETKDHLDWELIGKCADQLQGEDALAMKAAYAQVADQEEEHLYHSKGWCRELRMASLGMIAILPPPEVSHHFTTLVGAASAGQVNQALR